MYMNQLCSSWNIYGVMSRRRRVPVTSYSSTWRQRGVWSKRRGWKICTPRGRWRWYAAKRRYRRGRVWRAWGRGVGRMGALCSGKCLLECGLWSWWWVATRSSPAVTARSSGATPLGSAPTPPKAPTALSGASFRYIDTYKFSPTIFFCLFGN